MFLGWIWMSMLFLIPLFVLFILLRFIFNKHLNEGIKREKHEITTPLDILKNSYARGDISRDEFLQKRDDLLEK